MSERAGWRTGLAGAGLAGPTWEAKAPLGAAALLLFLFHFLQTEKQKEKNRGIGEELERNKNIPMILSLCSI